MKTIREKKYLFPLLMLLAVFAACKGESPTAPAPGGGSGGSTTPPVGSTLTLTAANANPQVSTQTTITATATKDGSLVPNGTAIEFSTTFGTFVETGTATALRTTTNGVATVTLTSSTAGTATVQAVVNNVLKTTSVTFKPLPPVTCPPDCPLESPTISGISPAFGSPAGGTTVTINGTLLKGPVRVFFTATDPGATAKEAFVVSRTDNQVVVVSPPLDLGTGQTKAVDITVVTQAGTSSEKPVKSPTQFTYQLDVLTPSITTISPASGPIDGGTNVVIFGDGFQATVQVFFGSAEARVLTVTFKQLTVVSPAARDTAPNGSGTITGPVDIKVININSNKSVTATNVFRYAAKMQITGISPTVGSSVGGTEIRIDGTGFNDPLTVDIGGIRALVIRVSGTEVIARTGALASPCASLASAQVIVTNIDNGDTATSVAPQVFSYVGVLPVINSISGAPPITIGSSLAVTVVDPGVGLLGNAVTQFKIGDVLASSSPTTITNGSGAQAFSVTVPPLTFATQACTVGSVTGVQSIPTTFPVTFTNVTTGCIASSTVLVNPASAACVAAPAAAITPTAGTCANAGSVSNVDPATGTTTISITNTGGGTLIVGAPAKSGTNAADFSISPATSQNIAAGATVNYTVTFNPAAAGAETATFTFGTNDPSKPTVSADVCGTGT